MQAAGAGELFLQSVEREGSGVGYDVELVRSVCSEVDIPVVACGGAGGIEHMRSLLSDSGVTAVAAGTMFVLHGKHRAPLISFPTPAQIEGLRQ
jgi:cyclase